MFEHLKENIVQEKNILENLKAVSKAMDADPMNKAFYVSGIASMVEQLVILNASVPELLKEWSPVAQEKKTPRTKSSQKKAEENTSRISYVSKHSNDTNFITLRKGDREAFLKKLQLSEASLDSLKQKKQSSSPVDVGKPNVVVTLANTYFGGIAEKLVPHFSDVSKDLKKANIRFLLATYLAIAVMFSFLSFFFGLLIFAALLIINFSNIVHIWIPFALPFFVGVGFYFYPASESGSIQKKISQELPFATIHMAAIAGSDIEPTRIFKIIATSKEYPNIGYEIRKILAQVEIYGYDLVTSLKNVSQRIPNRHLADLLSGLATNISTGGELKGYLEKKADNFLIDYRLEREKFADLAGTFMDVYISILIAAPLILMMMFIVMNVAGLGLGGLTIGTLLLLSIVLIVIVNIIFLFVLNLKQPVV